MKTKFLVLLASVLLLAGCSNTTASSASETPAPSATSSTTSAAASSPDSSAESATELTLTTDELAKFDGKDGNKAYIAVDGIVYDVSDLAEWKNGAHNGYSAGVDLTEEIKKAPHGEAILTKAVVVGKLAD